MKRYDVWIEPAVHQARKHLPGHFRQRVKRVITSLADDPRPPNSRALDVSELDVPPDVEPRRIIARVSQRLSFKPKIAGNLSRSPQTTTSERLAN